MANITLGESISFLYQVDVTLHVISMIEEDISLKEVKARRTALVRFGLMVEDWMQDEIDANCQTTPPDVIQASFNKLWTEPIQRVQEYDHHSGSCSKAQ